MKLLSIETATEICGIAYLIDGECMYLKEEHIPRAHAQKLPLLYKELVKKSGMKLHDLDGVAVSIGPGSFTGLRIGLSYGKGLAYSHGLPIIPVPTLKALTHGNGPVIGKIKTLLYSHGEIFFVQDFLWKKGYLKERSAGKALHISEIKLGEADIVLYWGGDHIFSNIDHPLRQSVRPSAKWIGVFASEYNFDLIVNNYFQITPEYISPFLSKK